MGDDIELYDSIAGSNLNYREKSRILSLLDTAAPSPGGTQTVLGMLVESTLSGTVGASLGVLQAELKHGLDYNGKYPIDLVIAALAKAGGVVYNSHNSRTVSNVAVGVFTYRKVEALLTMLKPKPSVATDEVDQPQPKVETETAGDPVAAAAKGLDTN